jgi:cyclophilin family peptidyl-prolyl cis-trans isomerase
MLSVNLGALNNIQVPGGKSALVPLTGMDSNNGALTYSFQSSDPNVTVSLVSPGSKSLVLNVSGTDKNNQAFSGTLVLHLFEDLAPIATARIEQLATQGFYNGKNFFRVLDGFVAQNNGSTGQTFDNEIVSSLTFNSPGLLAMANAGTQNGHGTNDAQFFITAIDNKGNTDPITLAHTPQFLNGNYTLFGQLVSGFDTFEKIMQAAVQTGPNFGSELSSPVNTITITSAQVIDDTHDAVLRVSAPASFDGHSATITVTATNASNETAHQSFTAAAVVDPPTLGTVTNQTTTATTPVTFTLTSQANDSTAGVTYKIFDATTHAAPAHVTISINQSTGQVTLTPDSGFVGTISLLAGARATTAADSFDNYDTGAFTLTVTPNTALKPTLGNVNNQTTTTGTAVTVTLTSTDSGGNGVFYKVGDATTFGTPAHATISINQTTGQVTITPAAGFTGTISLLAGVKQTSATDVQANYNTKAFTLTVNAPGAPTAPTSLSVDPTSNTGSFDGNGYTGNDSPKLKVTAVTGTTVKYKLNGIVIATATETAAGSGQFTATIPAGKLAIGSNSITATATNTNGTSSDSTAMTLIYAPSYAGAYTVPGTPGSAQQLNADWFSRRAKYDDEFGYFIVNSLDGSVGNVAPTNHSYAHTGIGGSTSHVLFGKGAKNGAKATLNVQGGQMIVFYMIQNNTTANFLAKNATDTLHGNNNGDAPLAFFSVAGANPDGKKHAQVIVDPTTGSAEYNWEDLAGLGDSDFNDAVLTVHLAGQSARPPATLHVPGMGNKTVTLVGTLGAGHQSISGDLGVYFVDNPDGSIGTLKPGDPGYAAAALASANSRVLFGAGSAAGAHNVTVPAGKYLGFYLISAGTTANFLTSNPTNNSQHPAVALFSFASANPSQINHFRWYTAGQTETDPTATQLHIMNKVFGKESDFDDLTLKLSFSA